MLGARFGVNISDLDLTGFNLSLRVNVNSSFSNLNVLLQLWQHYKPEIIRIQTSRLKNFALLTAFNSGVRACLNRMADLTFCSYFCTTEVEASGQFPPTYVQSY